MRLILNDKLRFYYLNPDENEKFWASKHRSMQEMISDACRDFPIKSIMLHPKRDWSYLEIEAHFGMDDETTNPPKSFFIWYGRFEVVGDISDMQDSYTPTLLNFSYTLCTDQNPVHHLGLKRTNILQITGDKGIPLSEIASVCRSYIGTPAAWWSMLLSMCDNKNEQ